MEDSDSWTYSESLSDSVIQKCEIMCANVHAELENPGSGCRKTVALNWEAPTFFLQGTQLRPCLTSLLLQSHMPN